MGIKQLIFRKEIEELEQLKQKTKRIKKLEREVSKLQECIRKAQTDRNNLATRIMKLENENKKR